MNLRDVKKINDEQAVSDSNEPADEIDLVAALRLKNSAAYETLIRRYGGRMKAAANRYLHDEQDCTEAVQEAFISVFQAIDSFEGKSQLGTWLHRIVINVCLMKLRSRSRRPEISIETLLPTFDASGHYEQPARQWNLRSDEELLRTENRAIVRQSIDMLPDEYREVVLLRDIEEYSTEEAAQALKITPGAVKTRLHRARQALRALLEPHFAV